MRVVRMRCETRIDAWLEYQRNKRFQFEIKLPQMIWFKPAGSMYWKEKKK
jgi:hypothetical protein